MNANVGAIEYAVSMDTGKLIDGSRKVTRELDNVGRAGDKLQSKFTQVASAISAAIAGIAVGAMLNKLVATQRQFDVMFASLKTMTGGVDQAGAAFDRLRKFSETTPYTLEQSVQGFVKLKALGLDPSERAMTSFGNTASAMGKDLMQMIEAVADASTSEFERLKEFGIKAKVSGDDVSLTFRGVTTTIKNSSEAITQYLVNIGETDFAGAMSERMNTLDGNISNLQDSLSALYLTISQAGIGEAVASGARQATEAISQMTASVKQGGLTEYFDGLKPYITAAELAVVSLAGAMAGRLVAAFVATAMQAYAAATAIGAATIATRGFTAALALLGGPIGIAITGLSLLALNWDKVTGSAKTAAKISEESAGKIARALSMSADKAGESLSGQLTDAEKQLDAINKRLADKNKTGMYGTKASPEFIKGLEDQRDAHLAAIEAIKKAQTGLWSSVKNPRLMRQGAYDPELPATGGGGGGGSAGKAEATPAQKYTEDLQRQIEKEQGLTAVQQLGMDINAGRLGKLSTAQQQALIQLAQKVDAIKAQTAAEDALARSTKENEENSRRLAGQQENGRTSARGIIAGLDPVDAIRFEEEQRIAVLEEYRQLDLENEALYVEAKEALHQDAENRIKDLNDRKRDEEKDAQSQQLQAYSALFDGMADMTKQFGGEQSDAFKMLFAASKGFAIADAGLKLNMAIMQALADPTALTPMQKFANYAAIATAGGALISSMTSMNYGGGRQYGGPVSSGSLYRVNETGAPEMYTANNGNQYMMPTKSGKVTAADKLGGNITIINNTRANIGQVTQEMKPNGDRAIFIHEVADAITSSMGDPNSKFSRGIGRNFGIQRSR